MERVAVVGLWVDRNYASFQTAFFRCSYNILDQNCLVFSMKDGQLLSHVPIATEI